MKKNHLLFVTIIVFAVLSWSGAAGAITTSGDIPAKSILIPTPLPEKDTGDSFPTNSPGLEPSIFSGQEVTNSHFGYTMKTSQPYGPIDLSSGTRITFPNQDPDTGFVDDDYYGPLSIGFDFKYFENKYNKLYISTNGLITFDGGEKTYRNVDIPRDSLPNNFITAFWDDLDINYSAHGGQVRYKLLQSPKRFVIEWRNVVRHNIENPPLLTFQVILYENGDILFQYENIDETTNQATAGIEDSGGRDGLRYLYNQTGFASKSAVLFEYPKNPTARVKTLPAIAGKFTTNRKAVFPITVINTGDFGTDVYDLEFLSGNPGWRADFYKADGITRLNDTNKDGKIDTGPVDQGKSTLINVFVTSPDRANVGEWSTITVTARSSKNPLNAQSTKLQSAVPAAFAQSYTDEESGFRLGLFCKASSIHPRMEKDRWFSGSTLAITSKSNGNFLYAWEMTSSNDSFIQYTDIEYLETDRIGNPLQAYQKLTSNHQATLFTSDRFPAMSISSSGYTGFIWIREVLSKEYKPNSNVYLTFLDPDMKSTSSPINLTKNDKHRGVDDLDVPIFASPKIAAAQDGRFIVTWTTRTLVSANTEKSDIWYSIYSHSGVQMKPPTKLTNSNPENAFFISPSLVSLEGNKVLLAYNMWNNSAKNYSLIYSQMDSSGTISTPVTIQGKGGWGLDGAQLSSGKVLLAWTHGSGEGVSYLLLNNDSALTLQAGPFTVTAPDYRRADYISVSKETSGSGIITWMDAEWNNHLYYLLVDENGGQKTPPMFFFSSSRPDIPIITSSTGQGISHYDGTYRSYLPITRRQ